MDRLCAAQLQALFGEYVPVDLLGQKARVGAGSRDRVFTAKVTFWAFLGQVLDPGSSCRKAVSFPRKVRWTPKFGPEAKLGLWWLGVADRDRTQQHQMKSKRRRHDPEFKARVALEALKGIKTIQQIAKDFDIHPVQVSEWKKVMSEGATRVFEGGHGKSEAEDFEAERAKLHSKIGQLAVEVDFLTKKSKQLGL